MSFWHLSRNHQHLQRNLGAAAAAAAVASVVAVRQKQDHQAQDPDVCYATKLPDRVTRRVFSTGAPPKPNVTRCDAALMSAPLAPRLRRLPTVVKLREIAEKEERLETKYNVQWQEPLGEGALGAVFWANNIQNGEQVAVKKISKKLTNNVNFQREMDALILLRESGGHPNICGMHENFEDDEYFYIVLDLIDGRELFEEICCNGAYSEEDGARLIREIASALAFMHGIGIVHTDLKPENVMLSSKDSADAVCKIVDLGCAHLECNAPHMNFRRLKPKISTPAYSPPEILLARENNKKCHAVAPSFDMWSLGVVTYIMLVGGHPYDLDGTATSEEIEEKVKSGEKPPLRGFEFAEHLSEDALALIEGLMEWDPQKRLTAEQVLENRWVQGETATSKKIIHSEARLKTQIGATFFRMLLSHTDANQSRNSSSQTSVLESAFRRLDTGKQGYLSAKDINVDLHGSDEDTKLYLSDIASLLAENMKNRYFCRDCIIFNEGERGDSMYLINSGKVEVTARDGFKKLRKSGDIIGLDTMMGNNQTNSKTARCVTPVHALEISRELFEHYVSSDKETFLSMAETAQQRRRERANTILRLSKECQQQSYSEGKMIFREGEKGENLYLLEDGEIEVSVHGHKVRSLIPGELTGEHAAYHGKPYNSTAKCVSESCKVHALPSKSMHSLFRSNPSLRDDFRSLMLRRDFKKALVAVTRRAFPTTEEEIRVAFDAVDTEYSGEIEFDKLFEIVRHFDPAYNEGDIRDMLESLDLNKSRSLTWDEFHRIFSMDKEA